MAISFIGYVANAKTGTSDPNVPFDISTLSAGTVQNGDVLLVGWSGNGQFIISGFTGWSKFAEVASASLGNPRIQGFSRYWLTGDPTSYTFVENGNVAGGLVCAVFRGVDATTIHDTTALTAFDAGTPTSLATTSISPATAGALLVSWHGLNSSSTVITKDAAMTTIFEVGGKKGEMAYEAWDGAGAEVRTWTNAAGRASGNWMAVLRPATGAAAVRHRSIMMVG